MGGGKWNAVEKFFLATLVLWLGSVCFQILLNQRWELLSVIAGSIFYQTSNCLIRFFFSADKDPLFVNTSVSLLHSLLTSASGHFSIHLHQFSISPLTSLLSILTGFFLIFKYHVKILFAKRKFKDETLWATKPSFHKAESRVLEILH